MSNNGDPLTKGKRKNRNTEIKIKLWGTERFHSCHWCDIIIEFKYATVDHVVAVSDNGDKGRDNCVLACWPCNHERGIITQLKNMLKKSKRTWGEICTIDSQWSRRIKKYVEKMECYRLCQKWAMVYQEKGMLEELYSVPTLDRRFLIHHIE